MRFKLSVQTTYLLLVVASILLVALQDKLLIYIHPRYIIFTITLCALAGLILIASLFIKDSEGLHKHKESKLGLIPLMLLVAVMIVIPPKTLSSSTVTQRLSNSQSGQQSNQVFSGSTLGLSVSDWFQILSLNEEPEYYALKPAKITGFIYDAGLGEDTVWVSRFILTCCAVDARPVGVPVRVENWAENYSEDDWVIVEGNFELSETSEGSKIVLIPDKIEKTEEPENPYEF